MNSLLTEQPGVSNEAPFVDRRDSSRAENPAGTDGALCDDTDLGGHADCAAGHLCVSGTCRELCRVTPDSCAVHRCVSFTASVDYVHDLVIAGGGPTGYCEP